MLFNATYAEELRVAAVEGQKLINFDIETSSKEQRRGNIYKGFITRVEPSLEACFVDYGTEKQGFLPFKEIDFRYLVDANGQKHRDFSKLPLGTELIVQVEKDERGNKGAALTTYITLPGRYLVLMPNNSRAGGISRRIEGEEREELKALMTQLDVSSGMSVILRTAALGRVVEELQWDLTYLTRLWEMINAASQEKGAFLIYLESSLVIRSIRDHFSPDIEEILIDTVEVHDQARKFMSLVMPNFANRIKLYRDDVPLFSRFQIEHQIESAYSRSVILPSGGVIVIDHTEALTSVDVNSAKANKGADIETTAFLTNMEAAEEVARQLRLRDLGGLVVVDFIDMENTRNQRELENHFKAQLSFDRARIQMGKLSKFGLLELSRQRLQASLDESSTIACPRCAGVGSIRGIESSALHLLRIIQEEVVKNSNHLSALHVQLPIDVATYLLNERREDVAKIEARMKVKIILIPNVHLNSPQYKIKKLSYDIYDSNFNKSSYNLVEVPEENLGYKSSTKKADSASKTPVIQEVTHQEPAPVVERKSESFFGGFFKKLGALFAPDPVKPAPKARRNNSNRNYKPRIDQDNNDKPQGSKNANRDNLKSRPVQVAKNNNKIQVVRAAQSQPQQALVADKVDDNSNVQQPRNEREERRSPQHQNTKPRGNNNEPKQAHSMIRGSKQKQTATNNNRIADDATITRGSAEAKPDLLVVTNKNLDNVAKSPILVEATPIVEVTEPSPVVTKAVEVIAPVVEIVKDVPLAKPEKVKYNSEPLDLGGLQMVSTSQDLLNTPAPIVELAPVKRLSDVVVEKKHVSNDDVKFELVETKR